MTELRALAERMLLESDLDAKLAPPSLPLTDQSPGQPHEVESPARTPELTPPTETYADRMPKLSQMRDPKARGVAHHLMANHELQAAEIMAATLLRHPDAPPAFRMGLAEILLDEQRHTRMHMARAAKLGQPFGSLRVSDYIWRQAMRFESVLDYLAGLPLVFEGANLDHSLAFARAFDQAGDQRSAHVMRQIHDDEIEHVAFGIDWLRTLKPDGQSDWETFVAHLHDPLEPRRARGKVFHRESRVAAGLDDEFIAGVEAAVGSPLGSQTTGAAR